MILVRCRSFESIVFVSSLRSWGQILFQEFPRNGETTVSGQARDSIASSRKRKEQFLGAAILEGNYFQSVHQHLVAASRCKGNAVLRHRAWKFQGTRLLVRFEAPWPAFDARTYTYNAYRVSQRILQSERGR